MYPARRASPPIRRLPQDGQGLKVPKLLAEKSRLKDGSAEATDVPCAASSAARVRISRNTRMEISTAVLALRSGSR